MSNTYFQFKEFRIDQDKCAMKVCTDSCLFGAWIPVSGKEENILDIGTGTGLLALMMAQRTRAKVDAVEIEREALEQAGENIKNSKWAENISIFHSDIIGFPTDKKYDLILANPPFYEKDLESEKQEEKLAKHAQGLTLNKLLASIPPFLHPGTSLALLLPYFRKAEASLLLETSGWHIGHELSVSNHPGSRYFRYLVFCSRNPVLKVTQTMSIYKNGKEYGPDFTELLSNFYL